jgi:hypothetical protein
VTSSRVSRPRLSTEASTALTAAAAALAVYVWLLDRHLGAWDTAEFQTVPMVFGIAHQPTYPAFTLLSGVWAWLPLGDAVTRMNLLSAVLFAVATGLLSVLLLRLGVRSVVAVAASLVFALSTGVITNATRIDVQALHLALMAALLLVVHRVLERPDRRLLMVAAVIVGVGMAHHGLMILTGPVVLVAIVLARRRVLLRPDVVVPAVFCCVAPLLLYLYPVLTADRSRLVNSNASRGWTDIFLARGGITGSMGTPESLRIWFGALDEQLTTLGDWVGPVTLIAALAGVALIVRRQHIFGALVVWVAAIASYAQATASDINDRYLLTVVSVAALAAAVAADAVVDRAIAATMSLGRLTPIRSATALSALVLLVPASLAVDALAEGRPGDTSNRRNAEQVLAALPERCVLWVYWDLRTTLLHVHLVDGMRPDITILDHRSASAVGSSYAATPAGVYDAVQRNPATTGRPVCHIGYPLSANDVPSRLTKTPVTTTMTPWGRAGRLDEQFVYVVEAR